MVDDPFVQHRVFPTGVWWTPTDYKPMDQTVYLNYADRRSNALSSGDRNWSGDSSTAGAVRTGQEESWMTTPLDIRVKSIEEDESGLIIHFERTSQEKHGS
jgi:hypothetical protein